MSGSPLIHTRAGSVRGRVRDGAVRYCNIPFAAPPVGPLRFQPPKPARPWSGVRDASAFGAAPPQTVDELSLRLGLLGDPVQSEDCLNLNVFVPDAEGERLRPVMVWLHGGAFSTGTAAGPVYDAFRLARDGDVVVVTLNYRVGALGFLFAGEANLGLQDQVAALRWVRDEIAAFGGDPGNVTVFGESAGAGSVVALLAMPSARGLFRRAIVQSAAPEGVLSRADAERRAEIFCAAAGIGAGEVGRLRELPASALVAAQSGCLEPGPRRIGMFFAPVVDGDVLPEPPIDAIAKGSARDVDLVIGTTAQEMQLYHLSAAFPEFPDALLPQVVAAKLPGTREWALARANDLLELYPETADERRNRFFAIETDASLFVPSARLAACQSRHNPATFMYRFCWASPMHDGRLGACHALDIAFALGTLDRVPEFVGQGARVARVARAVQDAWVSFARTGNPTCDATGDWPAYDPAARSTLFLDDPCRIVEKPDETRRRAWARARMDDDR